MTIDLDRGFLVQVDLVSLIEQKTPTRFGKPAGNGTKRTVKGPCPFCQGTDRFAVFINEVKTDEQGNEQEAPQRYYCGIHGNGCGAHGDAIDFLRQYEHLSFSDAVAALNGSIDTTIRRIEHLQKRQGENWESERWQKKVEKFCQDAETRLWSEEGQAVLDYLWLRGLTDETIKKAHLGAAPHKQAMSLVIPWYDSKHDQYWRVTLRNVSPQSTWRYDNYAGSSVREGLYAADSLAFNRPAVFLVEGELDALSLIQEAGDLVAVVATGTTTGSHSLDWVMELAALPHVFIAFDAEEQAEQSAAYWLDSLLNATRWKTPIGKDANEMLVRDLNIRLWVEAALSTLSVSSQVQKKRLEWGRHLLHNDRGLLVYCSECDEEATWWGTGVTPFCKNHWQPQWYQHLLLWVS